MGQYYLIVNVTKREYLHPHKFGNGLKLLEFGCSSEGVLTALAILLADGNNRGGGDLHSNNPIIGSWAGDKVIIAGDYADKGKFTENDKSLHEEAQESFTDVSELALIAMLDVPYIRADVFSSEHFGSIRNVLAAILKGNKAWAKEYHAIQKKAKSTNQTSIRPDAVFTSK